ncbi:MAG: CbrC family protein [Parachlamydiales bacterium]
MMLYQKIVNFMRDQLPNAIIEPELLQNLRDLDLQDKHYILRKSSEMRHLAILQALIGMEPNLDINDADSHGNTALIYAAENGHEAIVHFLLSQGADQFIINKDGRSALSLAMEKESLSTCRTLLQAGVKPEKQMLHPFFRYSLHDGHETKILPFVKLFLEFHLDPNELDSNGESLLSRAVRANASKGIIETLLTYKANCNLGDSSGITPFLYACKNGLLDTAKLLIEHGADALKSDKKGNSSLLFACQNQNLELVRLLVSMGVDIDQPNKAKETPLIIAIKNQQQDIAKFLIDSSANVNFGDKKKLTPIYFATLNRDRTLCQWLIEKGAKREEMEVAEATLDPIPVFKYYAFAELNNEIENTSEPCDCCKKSLGYLLKNPILTKDEEEKVVCPWCVSNGKAAKKFKVNVNRAEIANEETIENHQAIDELRKNTPSFIAWQGDVWLTHCNLPCKYIGRVGWAEIQTLYPQLEIGEITYSFKGAPTFQPVEKTSDQKEFLISSLRREGSCTGYLFQCITCEQYKMYFDSN